MKIDIKNKTNDLNEKIKKNISKNKENLFKVKENLEKKIKNFFPISRLHLYFLVQIYKYRKQDIKYKIFQPT